MQTILAMALLALVAGGCTTATAISGRDGRPELLVECGAAVSFSVCHERAKSECPAGYTTLAEQGGFNRKALRVRCH